MHLQPANSSGPQASKPNLTERLPPAPISSSLPFGHHIDLSLISPATYLTAQTLVQQTAYFLSDKIFCYSPDTFDLDLALKHWEKDCQRNIHGFIPGIQQMQTRTGAGSVALGYMFSKDFDLTKRHIPQSIVASSATLNHLRPTLDQLSLLYSVANPLTLQIAAADYTAQGVSGLITDYVSPQALAEDLGISLISSFSTFETQHMTLFSYLMANFTPAMHLYDGVAVGRETTRVIDVFGKDGLANAYNSISKNFNDSHFARLNIEGKILKLFDVFNDELGTDYKPFEYYGHSEADTVLVVFGSVEGTLAAQVSHLLAQSGLKVGAVNVRLYRPFIEENLIETLPRSVKTIKVLGQVANDVAVADVGEISQLYTDVLAACTFTSKFSSSLSILDLRYSRAEVWTPTKIASALGETWDNDILGPSVKQYTFWDSDSSPSSNALNSLAQMLAENSADNVALRSAHNNLARGGILRADIRTSSRSIEAPYSVAAASVMYIGDGDIFKDFDVIKNVVDNGIIIARLPASKSQEEEKLTKRLTESVITQLVRKGIQLFLLDPEASPTTLDEPRLESLLVQLAFLRVVESTDRVSLGKLEKFYTKDAVAALVRDLEAALTHVEYPESWKSLESGSESKALPMDVRMDSFVPFPTGDFDPVPTLSSATTVAQGLAFHEALNTNTLLRPDAETKTFTVRVKEHKRLTPMAYDRNIFHIEFDLGSSGLKYNLGEALGIHAENHSSDVQQFIEWYNLDPSAIVAVPSRANPATMTESRTIYQALMQNIDLFGRPPKRFYAELAEYATNTGEIKELKALGGMEGAVEFKRRAEVDTVTYADILLEFPSAHPSFPNITKLVGPLKRREYSIASSQRVQPNSVSLLIVTVGWVDPQGRDRFGQATRYLDGLAVGDPITVSVKPSVMKLPKETTAPIAMAGLGTGLAPFRAFVQERAYQRDVLGQPIGNVMLFLGSRHQREEYLYGEEWEAYLDAGVLTHMGCAFSRDQPQKIYIQGRMREAMGEIRDAIWRQDGAFYLCGPTWPVPDVTQVLQESVEAERKGAGAKKVNSRREIEELKDAGRYVLEVY